MTVEETAVLVGGPAEGLRITVSDRPAVVQVARPCAIDESADGMQAHAIYLYRRRRGEPLRYGFDPASP